MTRLILLMTLFGYLFTRSIPILMSGILAILSFVAIDLVYGKEAMTPNMKLHQVTNPLDKTTGSTKHLVSDSSLDTSKRKYWYPQYSKPQTTTATLRIDRADERPHASREQVPNHQNPMMNVMLTDYKDTPKRPRAQPAFAPSVSNTINKKTKEQIEQDLEDKLFKDMGDEINFDHSMRQFTTNPSTTIPNDQTAFLNFCYGNMSSCKDGELDKCISNETKLGQVYA